jgi:ferredoxin--NADP+ reductase
MYKILSKKNLASNIKMFEIEAPLIAKKCKPGQFIILKIHEKGERIPLTITDYSIEKKKISIIFQEVGKTTKLLGTLNEGEEIPTLVGPLGNPLEIENYGHIIGIGGGVGIAVLYPEIRALKDAGNKITSIIGARNSELLILEKEIKEFSDELHITTDDGSKGIHGFVTDVLKNILKEKKNIDLIITIGPTIMMKAVAEITKPFGIKTLASLNAIMMDGTGMCGVCRVSVGGKTKFTCVDGPEFDAHLVDFEGFMLRQRMYLDEEIKSLKIYESKNNCEGKCQ